MFPAILAIDLGTFASINEKVWYNIFKEPKLFKDFGTEFFFNLKNEKGLETVIPVSNGVFKLYRVK